VLALSDCVRRAREHQGLHGSGDLEVLGVLMDPRFRPPLVDPHLPSLTLIDPL
jgi:hypothetical protein